MSDEKNKQTTYELLVKRKLSEHLGIDLEDINSDDYLRDDLHMNSSEISDLIHGLHTAGINIDTNDVGKIESVGDIIETISDNEEL